MENSNECYCAELEGDICPSCEAQLTALERLRAELTRRPTSRDVGVVSIGVVVGAGVASLIAWAL